VFANTEVGLGDQVKELTSKLRVAERQLHQSEEQRMKLVSELENKRMERQRECDPRPLTSEEKLTCKSCIQNLLAAARESLAIRRSSADSSNSDGGDGNGDSNANAVDAKSSEGHDASDEQLQQFKLVLTKSNEDLHSAVMQMDKVR
jgi:hypothetical protein